MKTNKNKALLAGLLAMAAAEAQQQLQIMEEANDVFRSILVTDKRNNLTPKQRKKRKNSKLAKKARKRGRK